MIGRTLVREKIAACANIIEKMESIYYWNGELIEDGEAILISKTVESCFPSLEKRIRELHSYSNPCILGIPIQSGAENYLSWINESIRKSES